MLSKMILWFKTRFTKANRKPKQGRGFNADNPFLIL
jgi:hypothetical protein